MSLSVTLIIIIITVIVSLVANGNNEFYNKLIFNPYQVVNRNEWYRVFTHAFIHDKNNIFHLIFNMYVLYSFGNNAEQLLVYKMGAMGIIYYLILYIGGIAIASLPSLIKHKDNYAYNAVGASGAVAAVLFSVIAFIPFNGGIGIIFIPITLPPLVFGILYLGYEIYMNKKSNDNIAHDAHAWGAIYGFVFTLLFVPGAFTGFLSQLIDVFR